MINKILKCELIKRKLIKHELINYESVNYGLVKHELVKCKQVKHRLKKCFLVILSIMFLITACNKNETDHVHDETNSVFRIGILFHGLDMLGEAVFAYADYIEQHYNVEFEFATFETGMNTISMMNHLLDAGVDAIINASTNRMPELIELCEENGIYLLQFWDSPTDSDILEKYVESEYYLGRIIVDEQKASRQIADIMLNKGCENIAVIALADTFSWAKVHKIRGDSLAWYITNEKKQALSKVIRLQNNGEAINSLAKQGYKLDGLVTTENNFFKPLDEIQTMLKNPRIKLAHFDLTPDSRDHFLAGNLLAASCGHHNIVGLAFAYLYYLSTIDFQYKEKIDMVCDYLILTSVEDYDFYVESCIDQMPYTAEQIQELIDSFDQGLHQLEYYCNNYTLNNLKNQRQQK